MSKYNFEFKLKLVRENEEGYGSEFLSSTYGVEVSTISNWIRQYKMYGENGLRKSMSKTKYTGEFKLSVIKYRQYHELFFHIQYTLLSYIVTINFFNVIYNQLQKQSLYQLSGPHLFLKDFLQLKTEDI
ncbi:MAG: transposase [Tissierellia bacterium]|nr:transposase [Tissierellia bacterium]